MTTKISSIIFDLGAVLISNDDIGVITDNEKTLKLLRVPQEKLLLGWDNAWPDFRDGKISEDDFFKIFLEPSGIKIKQETIEKLKKIYRENVHSLPTFELLPKLQENYDLYALTNIAEEWLDFKRDKYNLEKYFLEIVSSSSEGVHKPNPEIFKRLVKKTSINPKRSLFIDDSEKNTAVAQDLGFNTITLKDKKQLVTDMKKFNIRI